MSDITTLPLPKERNLYFSTGVDEETIATLSKDIIAINEHDSLLSRLYDVYDFDYKPKPINIYIDSYGGQVYQVLGLISIMEKSESPIHTYCTGTAMSAGFIMLISGHKRFAHKYSTIMLHQLSTGTWGMLKEIEDHVVEMKRLQAVLDSIILEKTKVTRAQLKTIYTEKLDWYLTSPEALEFGMIDEIV